MRQHEVHELKIHSHHFNMIVNQKKTFEIRFNDRNYKINDFLLLRVFENNKYLDYSITVRITDVYLNYIGVKENYIVIFFKPITRSLCHK